MFYSKNLSVTYDPTNAATYIEFVLSREKSAVVSLATQSACAAGAIFKVYIEGYGDPTHPIEFIPIALYDSSPGVSAAADSVTGPNKFAWTDIPGVTKVRIARSDNTGGNGLVAASISYM